MRSALALALCLMLAGCGGGGGGSSSGGSSSGGGSVTHTLPANGFPVVTISGTGNTAPASYAGTFNLHVKGTTNTVTIAAGSSIAAVLIEGTAHSITFSTGTTVSGTIEVYGTGHALYVPASSSYTINDHSTGTNVNSTAVVPFTSG